MIEIRDATVDDAKGIAKVHVTSWQQSYRKIVHASYLDSLSIEARAVHWREQLLSHDRIVLVAVDDSEVVGFLAGGDSRIKEMQGFSELYALYIAFGKQGLGVGSLLVDEFFGRISNDCFLWVFTENTKAIKFYENAGFALDGCVNEFELDGENYLESRMVRKRVLS